MAATVGEILDRAAKDGSIDAAEWPRTLEVVLERLEVIVKSTFPLPPGPPSVLPSQLPVDAEPGTGQTEPPSTFGQAPKPSEESRLPTTNAATGEQNHHGPQTNGSDTQPSLPQAGSDNQSQLPPGTQALYDSCIHTLRTNFSKTPPYTLQRLAELIVEPQKHYRFLPSYLVALDQILSVSSSTTDFPMPALQVNANSTFLTNGSAPSHGSDREGLAGDESLGGALLTPIPWLKQDAGPAASNTDPPSESAPENPATQAPQTADGDDHVSTDASLRAEGAVTQGELLRQEQQAGVVPVAQTRRPNAQMEHASETESVAQSVEDPQGQPHAHARGPETIGMEDMGPQQDGGVGRPLDIEGAVGRGRSVSPQAGKAAAGADDGDKEHDEAAQGQLQEQASDGNGGAEAVNDDAHQEATTGEKEDEEMPDAT